jgi:hypothetical protein
MLDRAASTQEVDWTVLGREEPPSFETAREHLTRAAVRFSRVVSTDRDSILYLDDRGRPMTAWVEIRSAPISSAPQIVLYRQAGFAAEPAYVQDGSI